MWYTYVYSIFSSYFDIFCQKLSQYGEKILHTYVHHIAGYLGNCEALHEITDLVHEMLSVWAPLRTVPHALFTWWIFIDECIFMDKLNSKTYVEILYQRNYVGVTYTNSEDHFRCYRSRNYIQWRTTFNRAALSLKVLIVVISTGLFFL